MGIVIMGDVIERDWTMALNKALVDAGVLLGDDRSFGRDQSFP